ncbi:MAG TPA: hypothetical protein VFZ65_14295 [Planctomycetota bacterium]|nr:hypothetical protein [Planctomycetota bacterium]
MKYTLLGCALLVSASVGQVPTHIADERAFATNALRQTSPCPFDRVQHDAPGDGRLWAHGADWKASFDREGFTFVPMLPGAPHDFALALRVSAVRVGGQSLPFAAAASPVRDGDRVTFDRGAVREVYDLAMHEVAQSFVVDTALPGDVEVELSVASDLVEDGSRPGLQFTCEHGGVGYGDAFVVRGAEKAAIATHFAAGRLRLCVPAAERGEGLVVIDPVLSTQSTSASAPTWSPDAAYDATNDRYLVAWQTEFSATDHDIWTEMFDGNGVRIASTGAPIDISTWDAGFPRVADLDAADRFLVVASFADPSFGGNNRIYGRTRDAVGFLAVGPVQLLSDPNLPGTNGTPDVGADSGTGAGNHDWLVVWSNRTTINDSNIHGRLVTATGQPRSGNVLLIEFAGTVFNANVQVSKGNGNGLVDHPLWCVVYSRYFGATVAQVFCRTVDPDGVIGAEVPCDDSQNRSLFPQVSSPIRDGSSTRFLVTFERQSPVTARAVCVAFAPAWAGTNYFDLTSQFGMIGQWLRTDSDGVRFVVANKGFFATVVELRTLAWTGGGLALHDQSSLQSDVETEIAACRSSGGPVGAYAITSLLGSIPRLVRYGGYTPGAATNVLPTACGPLAIQSTGFPALGSTMDFTLSNFGSDAPGFLFGGAATLPIPICATCSLGLRLDLPIFFLLATSTASITIPGSNGLVGQQFAMQGFGYGTGACLSGFHLSDTIRFTIR